METSEFTISLQNSESFVTTASDDVFRVISGSMGIYIAPWKNGKTGRRILLCEAKSGTVVPSFAYRDQDYMHWRFVFVAREETELKRLPSSATTVLLSKFALRVGLNNVSEEGFENSVVEWYKRELVKDNIFIERGKQQAPKAKSASYSAIKEALSTGENYVESDNTVYKTIAYVCQFMNVPITEFDEVLGVCGDRMDIPHVATASHIICRDIILDKDWHHSDCGIIVSEIDGELIICLPSGHGYKVFFPVNGRKVRLSESIAKTINPKAYSLSRTLPAKEINTKELTKCIRKELSKSDILTIVILGLFSALIGVLLPTLNQKVYDDYIPLGDYGALVQICALLASYMIGNLFFSIVKNLCELRLQSRAGYHIQDAVYYRLFYLPEKFFHDYDSADLAQRIVSIGPTINKYISSTVVVGISTAFSFLYLARMIKYSKKLTWISMLLLLVYVAILVPLALGQVKYEKLGSENRGAANAKLYQYLNGIEKIRMAGVEERAIYDYMLPFSRAQATEIHKNRLSTATVVISSVSSSVFSMVLYYVIVKSKIDISMGSFVAFNTAFGTFSGSIQKLVESLLGVYQVKPTYDRFKPILETACENTDKSDALGELTGDISIHHVSFSYVKSQKAVLDDINLDIHKGEYLGIVGSSGCGKSTLLKLLLGFETPDSGQICYDGHDIRSLDKQALRRNLGVVLQNGKLIAGSIYENITITAPEATMAKVNEVIDEVGLTDDIAQMPMGVHTVLSENSGTISGGQQQRILIARAIIRKPSILIFDEATSALDNLTQAEVCNNLDRMKATRIVVAHRLSTIRNCDRIIVMQNGRIAEEGKYELLMQKKGIFYQLASRQISEEVSCET